MTISELQAVIADNQFHHATYRDFGTLWEGLHIYGREEGRSGFRGYKHIGAFFKDSPELVAAETLVRGSGVSVGSYGNG